MEERLEVIEKDFWDEFEEITNKIFITEEPCDRVEAENLACLLRMKIDTACAMYNYERRER